MTEDDLLTAVIDLCRLHHLKVAHFRPARTMTGWRTAVQGDPGFPDLVIAGPGGVLFAELKDAQAQPTHAQRDWLHSLASAAPGHNTGVWRPIDLTNGTIPQLLADLARGVRRGQ